MKSLSLEEGNIIKDIRNLFRLKRKLNYTTIEHEEKNCYRPIRVSNFWSNNYIEYESNGDRNKILSAEEYLNKISPYLKDIINNLKKYDTWKIQLTKRNDCISSIDNDEEHVMHSKSDSIEIMIKQMKL